VCWHCTACGEGCQRASGFIASSIPRHDRQDGKFYRSTLPIALNSGASWVVITTWNEFLENTMIEPSELYGTLYLDTTRELILPWKEK